ncbi:hypothetical protein K469DRAFT_386035 [Zopfia rhizophila CBS 207.26]|uniref:Uncharacterized protein n=1 Tax=Zopfia rhizophila CBS 207.26 TaxID=1314779 RepID=A0A6A6EEL8_9PEZI|nr:hypothetical protein K469DRAFT_386035 [Zopfia rhizophila CBS 207.26]
MVYLLHFSRFPWPVLPFPALSSIDFSMTSCRARACCTWVRPACLEFMFWFQTFAAVCFTYVFLDAKKSILATFTIFSLFTSTQGLGSHLLGPQQVKCDGEQMPT